MANVRLVRYVLCLVCSTILAVSAPWVMLSCESDTIAVHGSVTTVPAGRLLNRPANFFDLEGTAVMFSPNGEGEYAVAVGKLDWRDPGSEAETISGVLDWNRIPRTDASYLW